MELSEAFQFSHCRRYVIQHQAFETSLICWGLCIDLCLGILGEYVGHIYSESKGRPLYLLRPRRPFSGAVGTSEEEGTAQVMSHRD
jgi:hypothetical protein